MFFWAMEGFCSCSLCSYVMHNDMKEKDDGHWEAVRLASRWIPTYLYAKLCNLCSYEVHNDMENEDDGYWETMGPCLCLCISLVEEASCSCNMYNDREKDDDGHWDTMSSCLLLVTPLVETLCPHLTQDYVAYAATECITSWRKRMMLSKKRWALAVH
jgi:hypothetical protein